jgi:hypothetical protein
MNSKQSRRRARAWASTKGVSFRVEKSRGKGGHQIVHVGETGRTTVKTGEIGTGLLVAMLEQLGIPPEEF